MTNGITFKVLNYSNKPTPSHLLDSLTFKKVSLLTNYII